MLYHTQEISGTNGDCFRAAIASLLDAERVEDVPHFFDGNPDLDEGWAAVRKWLMETRGLHMVTVSFQGDLEGVLEYMRFQNPGVYYLISGHSGVDNHVVVACGDKIIHDPAGKPPGKHSLVGPCTDGYYWLKFLLPLFHGQHHNQHYPA